MKTKLNNNIEKKHLVKMYIPYYGYGGMLTYAKSIPLKENAICENYKCKYGSRIWINNKFPNKQQIDSVHSETCPIHGTKLLKVGCGSEIPKFVKMLISMKVIDEKSFMEKVNVLKENYERLGLERERATYERLKLKFEK